MSELKPLLDSELPEELASVLRSAEADGPEEHATMQSRTLAAIAAHGAVGSYAPERRVTTGIRFAKVLALGIACAGSAALLSTFGSSAPQDAHPAPPSMQTAPPSMQTTPPSTQTTPPSTQTTPPSTQGKQVEDLPTVPVEEVATKAAAPAPIRRGREAAALDDEVAIIDSARAALAAKRPEAALARVETYQRRFRSGHLTEEANALEIQALAAMGRRDEAKSKGKRFFASYPGSAYGRRVQSVLASEVAP